MKNKAALVPLIFILLAIGMLAYRHFVLNADLIPAITNDVWKVEVSSNESDLGGSKTVKLNIPSKLTNAKIIQESFGQAQQGLTAFESNGVRTLVWSKKSLQDSIPEKIFSYSAVMRQGTLGISIPQSFSQSTLDLGEAFADFNKESFNKYARHLYRSGEDLGQGLAKCFSKEDCFKEHTGILAQISLRKKAVLLANVLRDYDYRTAIARGFVPLKPSKSADFYYWVRAEKGTKSVNLFLDNHVKTGKELIFWDFLEENPEIVSKTQLNFSILPDQVFNFVYKNKDEKSNAFFDLISLKDLPASVQVVYRIMLLIPVGALLVCFFRIIIGVPVFGMFMPVLIALSFNQVGLKIGITLLMVMVVSGLVFRGLMTRMRLLSVARISCTLIFVIMSIAAISKVSWSFNFVGGFSATLFPIIVISMIIERMSIMMEESGLKKTVINLINSVIMASIVHLVISQTLVQYWTFSFWEVHLLILAALMMIGRYNGYRLSELIRFKSLALKNN